MKTTRISMLGMLGMLILLAGQMPALGGSAIIRVTTDAAGAQGNVNGCPLGAGLTACASRSRIQSISANGRYIAFTSLSSNLVPNDTNTTADIFVKDRWTGAIVRASTASDGTQADLAHTSGFTGSHNPSISANGRFIAFESYASNLVPGDTNGQIDIFVKDLQTGIIGRILFGQTQGNGNSFAPAISADGRYVAFISTATNIYPDFASTFRVYRFDVLTGAIITVAGGQTTPSDRDFDVNSGASLAISGDGKYVTFGGKEPGFTWWRVLRRGFDPTTMTVASVNNEPNSANGHSSQGNTLAEDQNLDMSPDGRFVVFTSDAVNLDPGDTAANRDVYLHDFHTGTTELISRGADGQSLGGTAWNVSVSGDGRFVAFDSNVVGLDGRDVRIFVRDRQFNTIRNATYNPPSTSGLFHPSLSDNGRYLSFHSTRSDLIPNDTSNGGLPDVFVVDLLTAPSHRNNADFDGEALADFSVFRPSNGNWYWLRSIDNAFISPGQWGLNGDLPVPADFDGDAKTDLTVFRPSNGFWYSIQSETNTLSSQQWGLPGDNPVAGDYDGDGRSDLAVWRPSDNIWYIAQSNGSLRFEQWGLASDKPIVGDFNGDGKTDLTVFRPSNNTWYIRDDPASGLDRVFVFGLAGDKPVPADYNGDGITDLAVYRPSNGSWHFNKSRRNLPQNAVKIAYDYSSIQWGLSEDLPVPLDFDGDGRADISLFRPSNGVWYQIQSNRGEFNLPFGLPGDMPIGFAAESQ